MPPQQRLHLFLILIFIFSIATAAKATDGFTQKDRELLITLKIKVEEIDKRFEQIDKRFEQIDKRFEQIDKRFEQVDKRFEQVGKQIDQLFNFLWILAAIFASITASTIGFAIWDRRSMIRPFESRVKELEEWKIDKVISSLKSLAETDEKVAEVLRRYNLL
ncbi:MAG: hypothetical protein ONB37_20150 [candidate division KSB1 bacterium]|nr:hypothetical protein [candidate division KSB1 bacterium]